MTLLNELPDTGTLIAPRIPMTVTELLHEGQRLQAVVQAREDETKRLEQEQHDHECKQLAAFLNKKFGVELAETAVKPDGERAHCCIGFNETIAFKPFGHAAIRFNVGLELDGTFEVLKFSRPEVFFIVDHEWKCDFDEDCVYVHRSGYTDSLAMAVAMCAEGEANRTEAVAKLEEMKKPQPPRLNLNYEAMKDVVIALIACHEFVDDVAKPDVTEVDVERAEELSGLARAALESAYKDYGASAEVIAETMRDRR